MNENDEKKFRKIAANVALKMLLDKAISQSKNQDKNQDKAQPKPKPLPFVLQISMLIYIIFIGPIDLLKWLFSKDKIPFIFKLMEISSRAYFVSVNIFHNQRVPIEALYKFASIFSFKNIKSLITADWGRAFKLIREIHRTIIKTYDFKLTVTFEIDGNKYIAEQFVQYNFMPNLKESGRKIFKLVNCRSCAISTSLGQYGNIFLIMRNLRGSSGFGFLSDLIGYGTDNDRKIKSTLNKKTRIIQKDLCHLFLIFPEVDLHKSWALYQPTDMHTRSGKNIKFIELKMEKINLKKSRYNPVIYKDVIELAKMCKKNEFNGKLLDINFVFPSIEDRYRTHIFKPPHI